jgi:hypothetical protein
LSFLLGKAAVLQSEFKDLVTGLPNDPPGVAFSLVDPLGVVTAATWVGPAPGTFSGASGLSRLSPGKFQFVTIPSYAGSPWRWSFLSTGTATPTEYAASFSVISTASYPYPYGYCDFADVRNRIVGGTWDETAADSSIIQTQVAAFIEEATAEIDMALAKRGYSVPLVPQVNMQISATVWNHLRGICGMLAAGRVELARHGSGESEVDNVGKSLISIARAQLQRIETGADNLTIFGVAGLSEPQVDSGAGMSEGTLVGLNGNAYPPLFTISGDVPTVGVPIPGGGIPSGGVQPW